MTDKEIIEKLGGSTKVAKLLNFLMPSGAQRVHNWKTRGIPAYVKLKHPELFQRQLTYQEGNNTIEHEIKK